MNYTVILFEDHESDVSRLVREKDDLINLLKLSVERFMHYDGMELPTSGNRREYIDFEWILSEIHKGLYHLDYNHYANRPERKGIEVVLESLVVENMTLKKRNESLIDENKSLVDENMALKKRNEHFNNEHFNYKWGK